MYEQKRFMEQTEVEVYYAGGWPPAVLGPIIISLLGMFAVASAGCAFKVEAKLLQPWNRDVDATSGERALISKARYLVLAGMSDEFILQNLVDQGLVVEEARRILALARTKESK